MYSGKTGEGGGGVERESPPPVPLESALVFFFLREFFSRAVLSDRLEQATLSYTIRSKNNCLRTLTVFFCGKRISRLGCLYARAYLKNCRRLKQNLGVFLNHGHNILFFFSASARSVTLRAVVSSCRTLPAWRNHCSYDNISSEIGKETSSYYRNGKLFVSPV